MPVILENTNKYRLDSHGNGVAYTMTHKGTMEERYVQYGDDATTFRSEYASLQAAYANPESVWHSRPWDACLAFLFWDCMAGVEVSL